MGDPIAYLGLMGDPNASFQSSRGVNNDIITSP
jgi:hypothetical protein